MKNFSKPGIALLVCIGLMPLHSLGQNSYREAQRQQRYHDARHHTKAKIVGGSAAGGALVGGLLGGGKGALIGAGVGAGGGLVANHVHNQHEIHKRQRYGQPR